MHRKTRQNLQTPSSEPAFGAKLANKREQLRQGSDLRIYGTQAYIVSVQISDILIEMKCMWRQTRHLKSTDLI